MALQSKLKTWTYLIVVLIFIEAILIWVLINLFFNSPDISYIISIPVIIFLVFILTWLVYGELRTKAIKIEISEYEIIKSGYLGLGPKKKFMLSDFDGYQIAILSTEYTSYEYLYLMINKKKVIKISEFYHVNYDEIKKLLLKKISKSGEKQFSLIRKLKEIST